MLGLYLKCEDYGNVLEVIKGQKKEICDYIKYLLNDNVNITADNVFGYFDFTIDIESDNNTCYYADYTCKSLVNEKIGNSINIIIYNSNKMITINIFIMNSTIIFLLVFFL